MTTPRTTYDLLHITPYEQVRIQELHIRKQMNEHTRLSFTAMVPEEWKDSYVQMTAADSPVGVFQLKEDGSQVALFHGTVLNIEIKVVRDVYYLEVDAVSYSYQLDIRPRSRSFQDKNMTVETMLHIVGEDYPGFDLIDSATGGAALRRLTVQYAETDWAFLKRIASRYRTSLSPASSFETPKLYFGVEEMPSGLNLSNYHYTVSKRIETYRHFDGNDTTPMNEQDFVDYGLETEQVLDLGSQVAFQGKSLYVYKVHTRMKQGILTHEYTMTTHKGLRHRELFNEQLTGLSLLGSVIQVERDRVRVHLDIDQTQEAAVAYWFPYASPYTAEGHSGWYVMPELGDRVRITFPARLEDGAFASSSAREGRSEAGQQGQNRFSNPQVKIFRTPHGKEIRLTPDEIIISSKDGAIFIRLNEKEGIHITSDQEIRLSAGGSISLSAGDKVKITAGQEIQLSSQGSTVSLGGQTTVIGSEVKTN